MKIAELSLLQVVIVYLKLYLELEAIDESVDLESDGWVLAVVLNCC